MPLFLKLPCFLKLPYFLKLPCFLILKLPCLVGCGEKSLVLSFLSFSGDYRLGSLISAIESSVILLVYFFKLEVFIIFLATLLVFRMSIFSLSTLLVALSMLSTTGEPSREVVFSSLDFIVQNLSEMSLLAGRLLVAFLWSCYMSSLTLYLGIIK